MPTRNPYFYGVPEGEASESPQRAGMAALRQAPNAVAIGVLDGVVRRRKALALPLRRVAAVAHVKHEV